MSILIFSSNWRATNTPLATRLLATPFLALLLILLALLGCEQPNTAEKAVALASLNEAKEAAEASSFSGTLSDYWYQGKAEVNTYDLEQSRYGELHPGEVVLIFVTEDFLTDKQVKNDTYRSKASAPIFKTNKLSRFTTGLYDYSMMVSVFTPTQTDRLPHTLKVTNSVQDWCGQTYSQLNHTSGQNWKTQMRSYFEQEGDQEGSVVATWLEDELMNRLRIDPAGLPLGEQRVLPSLGYLALVHQPFEAVVATTSLAAYSGSTFSGTNLQVYRLAYPSAERVLEIVFEAQAPYRIVGWTDTYPSRGKQLRSTAKLRKSELLPYWEMNAASMATQRPSFGL